MKKMKRSVLMFGVMTALFAVMAVSVAAQDGQMMGHNMSGEIMIDKSKPTVAIIRADWCEACQKLEPTFSELREQYKDHLNFVVLDVSNEEKVAASAKTAKELGITSFFNANKKNTSTVFLIGEKSKIGFKTTHNYDREVYVRAFDDAIKMNSMMMKKHG